MTRFGYAYVNDTLGLDPGQSPQYWEAGWGEWHMPDCQDAMKWRPCACTYKKIAMQNLDNLERLLQWNHRQRIPVFLLPYTLFPKAGDPYSGYPLEFARGKLRRIGRLVKKWKMRLFFRLPEMTDSGHGRTIAMRHMAYFNTVFDLMLLNEPGSILLCPGEAHDTSLDEYVEQLLLLPDKIKRRISLVNDPLWIKVQDLLPVCKSLALPLVMDVQAHLLHGCPRPPETYIVAKDPLVKQVSRLWKKSVPVALYWESKYPNGDLGEQKIKSIHVSTVPHQYRIPKFDMILMGRDQNT